LQSYIITFRADWRQKMLYAHKNIVRVNRAQIY